MTCGGIFDYQPLPLTLADLQAKALENRPDLRAAVQGVTAAGSQHELAKANGKVDVTGSRAIIRTSTASTRSRSMSAFRCRFSTVTRAKLRGRAMPLPRREQQQVAAQGQVMTDVRDA